MLNDMRLYIAIVMYMVGGLSLMIFNFVVIYRTKVKDKNTGKLNTQWRRVILLESPDGTEKSEFSEKHEKYLYKKLKNVENLEVFSNALEYYRERRDISSVFDGYMNMAAKSSVFQRLAFDYRRARNEERAYFAYFISMFPQLAGDTYTNLLDILISYIENANIYCRTNVLKALCKIGNIQALVNALEVMNDNYIFMYQRFLTDELMAFAGDKEALSLFLWAKYKNWNAQLMVSIVIFITMVSGEFKEVFFPILQSEDTDPEIRLAVVRYYRKYKYEPVRPILIEYVADSANINLAIVSAHTLSSYPGEDTTAALNNALRSSNWHLRYNSASNLVDLGLSTGDMSTLSAIDDKYAKEIVNYMMELKNVAPLTEVKSRREGERVDAS